MALCALILNASNPTGLLIWAMGGLCLGIGLFIYGFRLLLRRRLILDTPFSKIRSASMGMVEVSGLAVGPYTMVAPITAMPCYYYRTFVWEWKQNGKNKNWVKVAAESMHVPFFLDDNTGRVLIDPRGADLDLHCDFKEEFNTSFFSSRDDAPGNVCSFLARHGVSTNNKIRVEESCIKPKNALFILGTLSENPGIEVTPNPIQDTDDAHVISSHGITVKWSTNLGSAGTFDAGSVMQELWAASRTRESGVASLPSQAGPATPASSAQQERVAAALLKAGISNPAAWSAAGMGGRAVQLQEDPSFARPSGSSVTATNDTGLDHHPPVVLMKGTNNKTFLISWRSQQDVARSLGWKCMLMIWGGPILALLSLYVLLNISNLL